MRSRAPQNPKTPKPQNPKQLFKNFVIIKKWRTVWSQKQLVGTGTEHQTTRCRASKKISLGQSLLTTSVPASLIRSTCSFSCIGRPYERALREDCMGSKQPSWSIDQLAKISTRATPRSCRGRISKSSSSQLSTWSFSRLFSPQTSKHRTKSFNKSRTLTCLRSCNKPFSLKSNSMSSRKSLMMKCSQSSMRLWSTMSCLNSRELQIDFNLL